MTTAFTNHQDLGPSSTATLLFRQKCWRVPTLHHCRGEIQELQTLTAMPSTAAVVEKRELAATDVPWPWDVTFTHWSSWPVRVTNNDTLPPHSHDIPGPAFLCHLVPVTLPSNVEIFWCRIIPDWSSLQSIHQQNWMCFKKKMGAKLIGFPTTERQRYDWEGQGLHDKPNCKPSWLSCGGLRDASPWR